MFTLSAFADEIGPDPQQQIDVLKSCGIRHIEFRSIHGINVLALTDGQIADFKALLDRNNFRLSAIGSPIGKVRIDEPFGPHLEKFHRAVHLCGVFGTPNIRIFSYYPPEPFDGDWSKHREAIFDRMHQKLEIAAKAGIHLLHENEHKIYGDSPERVRDLFTTIKHPNFHAVYDPANYVFCGYDPISGWESTRDYTTHFHIKDWIQGEPHGSIPGQGHGRIEEVMADAVQRGYDGFATMEPHLLGGGPTGGQTGPELYPKAVQAFRDILARVGATVRD